MREFKEEELKKLKTEGQVTIIGGSSLFHGAPILALKTASRMVEMVFFASPEPSVGKVAEELKSKLSSFIWVPWEEVGKYIKKSNAVLIGPGFMRHRSESKEITEKFLSKFPEKQWVIDAGSLQVMETKFIPRNAILTPNIKEFGILFGVEASAKIISSLAQKHSCVIVFKGPETIVCSSKECVSVKGGNRGLEKGGTGDVLAGLIVALAAKNPPFLAACVASWIVKRTADQLYKKVGFAYNADDLAEKIPEVLGEYLR